MHSGVARSKITPLRKVVRLPFRRRLSKSIASSDPLGMLNCLDWGLYTGGVIEAIPLIRAWSHRAEANLTNFHSTIPSSIGGTLSYGGEERASAA